MFKFAQPLLQLFKLGVRNVNDEYKVAGLEAKSVLKSLLLLPLNDKTVKLTFDELATICFFTWTLFQFVLLKLFYPGLLLTVASIFAGVVFGLVLSAIYLRNKQLKEEINAVIGTPLGVYGVRHLLGALPSWFAVSDSEKMEWLNAVVAKLWPYYDKAVCSLVEEIAARETDALLKSNRALGAVVRRIRFKRLTFGAAPFRVDSVRLTRQADQVAIEVAVRYVGSPNITLSVELVAGDAKLCPRVWDISFVGTLRATLAPLMDRAPGFGAVVLSFPKPPIVRYRLDFGSALGGSVTAGAVTPVINSIIHGALQRTLIWPQRVVIPMVSETEEDRLTVQRLQLRHRGIVKVVVERARKLPPADISGLADPLVSLSCGDAGGAREEEVTRSVPNSLDPEWLETKYLLVQEPDSQDMRVTVYDVDKFKPTHIFSGKVINSRSVMCRALVRLQPVTSASPGVFRSWYHLGAGDWGSAGGPGKGEGKIQLAMSYRPLESFLPSELEKAEKGILIVRVVRLRRIPKAPRATALSVYVKVKLRDQAKDLRPAPWTLQRQLDEDAARVARLDEERREKAAAATAKDSAQPGGEGTAAAAAARLSELDDEISRIRERMQLRRYSVNFDMTLNPDATTTFYAADFQSELKLRIMGDVVGTDVTLGRLDVPVADIMKCRDRNLFTQKPEAGYLHKTIQLEEAEDHAGVKGEIELILRFVPYF